MRARARRLSRHSGALTLIISLATVPCPSVFAAGAEHLPLERDNVPAAIVEAAGRLGIDISLKVDRCGQLGTNCTWDVGDAVRLSAFQVQAPYAHQIEAQWNNAHTGSTSASAAKLLNLCASIIAATRPLMPNNEVWKLARQIALLKPSKKETVQAERRSPEMVFYGERTRPDRPDFPAEAFVQCGVVANLLGD